MVNRQIACMEVCAQTKHRQASLANATRRISSNPAMRKARSQHVLAGLRPARYIS